MRIVIKVKVNARKNEVEKLEDGKYLVHTTAIPVENQANLKVIELLGDYFGIAKSRISIFRGSNAHSKIVDIQ